MLTVGELVSRNGLLWRDHDAYVEEHRRVTWGEFSRRSDGLGHALREMGVKAGDRVAIIASDCIEVAESFAACAKIGAIRVGLNYRLAPRECAMLIRDADPVVLLFQGSKAAFARDVLAHLENHPITIGIGDDHGTDLDYETVIARTLSRGELTQTPHDILMIAYTTGSTGLPKGAVYPHRKMLESIFYIALAEGAAHDDVWLHAMPASGLPIMHLVRNLFHGSKAVIVGDWEDERALMLIERERATITVLVPTMLNSLINTGLIGQYDVSSMRQMGYGAAPLPPATIREAMKAFGCTFLQMYGTTELMGMSMMLYPSDHEVGLTTRPDILSSAGKPLCYVETRIVDERQQDVAAGDTGELIVKSEFVIPSYWGASEEYDKTVVNGWLHTGDMAHLDEDGYVYLSDRAKFRIKTGGYTVFPTEVENVLAEHAAINEVAVVGLPDEKWGERIHAVVTLKRGHSADAQELMAFCRGQIANFKIPKSIDVWGDIPKGTTGKILKRRIIAHYVEND